MEKIINEITKIKNNEGFAQAIGNHLALKCQIKTFEDRVNLEEKKLEECLRYIIGEIKRMAKGANAVAATDEEVFKLAEDYYTKEKDELKNIPAPEKVKVAAPKTEYAKVEAPEKVEVEKKESVLTKKEKPKVHEDLNQVSIFEFLG